MLVTRKAPSTIKNVEPSTKMDLERSDDGRGLTSTWRLSGGPRMAQFGNALCGQLSGPIHVKIDGSANNRDAFSVYKCHFETTSTMKLQRSVQGQIFPILFPCKSQQAKNLLQRRVQELRQTIIISRPRITDFVKPLLLTGSVPALEYVEWSLFLRECIHELIFQQEISYAIARAAYHEFKAVFALLFGPSFLISIPGRDVIYSTTSSASGSPISNISRVHRPTEAWRYYL